MRIVTGEEMRMLDRLATEEAGIPGVILMEHAGKEAAEFIVHQLHTLQGGGAEQSAPAGHCCEEGMVRRPRVLIVAGKGNNGGDGFVVHRWVAHWGYDCTTVLLAPRKEISGDAAVNLRILDRMQADVREMTDEEALDALFAEIDRYDLIVDAVLGTGLTGEVRGISRRAIEEINAAERPVVAIDIPSGLDAVLGLPLGVAVRADWTVTFALPKSGLLLDGGRNYVGELHVADIGIPQELVELVERRRVWMDDALCRKMLPCRPADGHKGTFGHVLVLAGSVGMTGAAALAGEGALRSGAGLVTLGIPASVNPILEVKVTEVMTRPLPEADGHLARAGMERIRRLLEPADVVAVGPGCGRSEDLREIVEMLLRECEKPLVIDADALNVLQPLLPILRRRLSLTVLTPHPGEMARLTGLTLPALLADRVRAAEGFAAEYGVVLVLKGAPTITVLPDGTVYFNRTGNEGMGTGGSGDVLTGVISGLLAQLPVAESVPAGVYIHGLAGDAVAAEGSPRSLVAGDLMPALAQAFRKLEMMNRR